MVLWLAVCLVGAVLNGGVRRHSRWPRRFLGGTARIAGVRVEVRGAPGPAPLLILANHVSWIDILALAGVSGTAFVAHDGLGAIAPLRWLCRLNHTVFIARERRGEVAQQAAQLRVALADHGVLTLFPEGTTSDGRGLLPFKSALLAAIDPVPPGLTVQPVAIDYGPDASDIAWVGHEHGARNALRILARRDRVPLTLHFLPPLAGDERAGRKAMAHAAQARIGQALEPR